LKPERWAVFGNLLDFTADPGFGAPMQAAGVRYRPQQWLLIDGSRIVSVQPTPPGEDWRRVLHPDRFILPGFIDTHVHSPQLDVVASYGTGLLEWLNTYTFPAERRYADPQIAHDGAQRFIQALFANGTTAACVFPTVHPVSVETLFETAQHHHMRLITGKCLMDRNAPEGLRDDVAQAEADCERLIDRWHGQDRLAYAVTVRFAPTSTPAQLAMASQLLRRHPQLYMQTHVAETLDEVKWVETLFPEAHSYLDVYHRAGLLNERTVLAHGIYLTAQDHVQLHAVGAHIAFCPSSNLFLGSGLLNWQALHEAEVAVSMGSDVGGGPRLCMLHTFQDAYKTLALQGQRLTAWKALYTATLGAAQALKLTQEIGSLTPGTMADFTVWDWASDANPVAAHRDTLCHELHERFFAWMMLADERNLHSTFVAGAQVYARP
jgi:guanine deaminase